MMKIGIDLKPFSTGSKYRGIGCFARGLIEELLKMEHSGLEFYFLNLYEPYQGDPELNANCRLYQYHLGPQIVDVGERQLLQNTKTIKVFQGAVSHFLEQSQIDVMVFPSPNEYGNLYKAEWFQGVYKVGIVHDVIPLLFPDQFLFDPLYKKDYEQSIDFLKGLDLLLTNSQTTKKDVEKLAGIPEEKVAAIYAGIDTDYKKLKKVDIKRLKEKYQISDPFLLFAGGDDFKKNIEKIIVAYSKCGKEITDRYQLVIVGKMAPDIVEKYMRIAEQNCVRDRVLCTGFIPKEDLIQMYNITQLVVFPSLYEGFGLPVIEAMACGARVVTSNTSSLKEIAKGHATLVSPTSVHSIAKGIRYALENPVETFHMAEQSISYAQSFTWKAVAERMVEYITKSYLRRQKVNYDFEVTEDMARNIVRVYAEAGILFDQKQQEDLAEQLVVIQDHKPCNEYDLKHRLLFDVTVVHEWMKAGYMTGIARVSNELYQKLSENMQVIPVMVEMCEGKLQCNEISMKHYDVIHNNIELRRNDIFLMPEIQLRGIHVPQKHPHAYELQKKGIQTYAIIYDILPLKMPQYFEQKTSRAFGPYIKEIVQNYNGIICDSRCVADDVIAYCKQQGISAKKKVNVGYFHLGQDTFCQWDGESVSDVIRNFFEDEEEVYLMLGTVEPRKGHALVLDAFEMMWKNGSELKLCIVGHVGWNMDAFIKRMQSHPEKGRKFAFFEAVKDSEVAYVYQHAKCLIQASAGEGFGLPLIEASKYNLPVLCSNIEVFHEVADENVNYFERTTDDLIKKIYDFENGQAVYESRGMSGCSWTQAAEKVYQMIVKGQGWYQVIQGDKG